MELWNNSLGVDPVFEQETTSSDRIGERIRTIRQAAGMSLTELGEKVGLNADRMQKYENGQRKPKPDMLKKIADALSVSVMALEDPVVMTDLGLMYALFEMERYHRLKVVRSGDEIHLVFGDGKHGITNDFLDEWEKECQFIELETKSAASNEEKEAIRKEYLGWIWNFPETITKRTNEELIERLQKRIEYLKQEDSNKTTKDDEG